MFNKKLNNQQLGRENQADIQAKRGTGDKSRNTEHMPGDLGQVGGTEWKVKSQMVEGRFKNMGYVEL